MNEKQLLELKEEIETAKSKIFESKGIQKQLMKDLKQQWDRSSLEEAKKAYTKFRDEITKLDKRIDKGVKELNEMYEL